MAFGDPQVHYDLGAAYSEMGLLVEAIVELETATRLDRRNGAFESALATLRKLREQLGLHPTR
jgi:hypothetical protein